MRKTVSAISIIKYMQREFTLVEILVAVGIVGIIVSILLILIVGSSPANKEHKEPIITPLPIDMKACIDNGGVPILNRYERMIDCKFRYEQ